jgi:solute carrier family 8 (sodium/calcium exchanger)
MVTACVSDLAELFGCVLGVPDIVTAVTFVALGTSMPDLFASLSAAKEDPTADASIVNVTGSNSVNVFLGLGVPWTIASIYWMLKGRDAAWEEMYPEIAAQIEGAAFVVESKNLGFSVLTFCVVCCVALVLLHLRRKWLGGELGGPFPPKINTLVSFLGLWVGWVGLVSWRVMRWTEDIGMENMMVQGGAMSMLCICTCISVFQMKRFHSKELARLKSEEKEAAEAALREPSPQL